MPRRPCPPRHPRGLPLACLLGWQGRESDPQGTVPLSPFRGGHHEPAMGLDTHSKPGPSLGAPGAAFPCGGTPGAVHPQPHHPPPAAPPGLEVVEARAAAAAVPSGHVRQAGALAAHRVAGSPRADGAPGVAAAGWGWGQERESGNRGDRLPRLRAQEVQGRWAARGDGSAAQTLGQAPSGPICYAPWRRPWEPAGPRRLETRPEAQSRVTGRHAPGPAVWDSAQLSWAQRTRGQGRADSASWRGARSESGHTLSGSLQRHGAFPRGWAPGPLSGHRAACQAGAGGRKHVAARRPG